VSRAIPVVLVLPRVAGSEDYVATITGGAHVSVKEDKLNGLGVPGTPTVLLADKEGTVSGIWTGLVTSDEEAMIMKRIADGGAGDFFKGAVSGPQVTLLLQRPDITLLDIRERDAFSRGHLPGAVNIPLDELQVRARRELGQHNTLVLDCTFGRATPCEPAESALRERGFQKIAFMTNDPYGTLTCSAELPKAEGPARK
jgi:rhodanese-related sulfurtransferase